MKPLDPNLVSKLAAEYGTPCYVYFAETIRERLRRLRAFDVVRYAQKASSNLSLLRLVRQEGALADAVSLGEIERALRAGFRPGVSKDAEGRERAEIVFTADIADEATLARAVELGIPVNAGSADMLDALGRRAPGHPVWLRVNPGFGHGHSRKTNTGGDWSKHGIWHASLADALRRIDQHRLDLVGLHMHIGSGTDLGHLRQVCEAMVEQVATLGRDVRAISAGGGLPVPYRPGEAPIDTAAYFQLWDEARKRIEKRVGHPVQIEVEPGRYVVAESGLLLARVFAVKEQGANRFILVDTGFNDLARPVMYGSYHEITIVRAGGSLADGPRRPTAVGGPLCESGDVFTQSEGGIVEPRELPDAQVGDLVVFHDTGAYGACMGSNYNSRPLPPEVLVDGGGHRLIRRRQTIDEMLELEGG
jgi:diaminopimelate decarboxylase